MTCCKPAGRRAGFFLLFFLLVLGLLLSSCAQQVNLPARVVDGGDAQRGLVAIQEYGCPTCHTIPGVPGANGMVGPPLIDWSERQYIAGLMPNMPDNLIQWIMDPQQFEPGTIMPNMGVSEQDARDISAYLYTIGKGGIFGYGR